MAPSKSTTIAFLLAFAVVVAATLQPSAAIRDATAKPDDEAPTTSAAGDAPATPASPGLPPWRRLPLPPIPCIPGMPRLPFLPPCSPSPPGSPLSPTPRYRLPPIPCIPGVPRLPWMRPCTPVSPPSPTPPSPPQPAECHTALSGMMPCAGFLTNATVTAPPAACCDGLKAVVKDAPVCMCHVVNGDFGRQLPAPALRLRVMQLPRVCGAAVPRGTLLQCIRGPVPPATP